MIASEQESLNKTIAEKEKHKKEAQEVEKNMQESLSAVVELNTSKILMLQQEIQRAEMQQNMSPEDLIASLTAQIEEQEGEIFTLEHELKEITPVENIDDFIF